MNPSIRSTLTFRLVIIFVVVCALQVIPWTGIFLMVLGAPIWTGFILHLIALALVLDAVRKRVPKTLLLIPLLLYGAYYLMFLNEEQSIKNIETAFQQTNPSEIIAYNPAEHSLVAEASLIQKYKLPVIYSPNSNFPGGYLSNRLATKELCKAAKDESNFTYASTPVWYRSGKNIYDRKYLPNVCDFRMPDRPDKTILKVLRSDVDAVDNHLLKTTYSFSLGQDFLGEYVSAYYKKMPIFPNFFIGCGLISSTPAWKCYFQLARERVTLDTFPKSSGQDEQDISPIMRLLKIEKYTEHELRSFTDYPETREKLLKLAEGKDDLDEWGLRKGNPYKPIITEKNGIPSFQGSVYSGNKGGYFYDFIKENEGRVVYLDIDELPNVSRDSFTNRGICKEGVWISGCTSRTDIIYQFKQADGTPYYFEEGKKFQGLFQVGQAKTMNNEYNKDNDTITILTALPEEKLKE